jgi:hypothetical protein
LAPQTQVRKESWGLLFYAQERHKVTFIKSADWLHPDYFTGNWDLESILEDAVSRSGKSPETITTTIQNLTAELLKKGMIRHELR